MEMTENRNAQAPELARYGFIYVMKNDAMPNAVKIGQTERHPFIRALELSQHTGIPSPFRVVCFWEVTDRIAAEQRIKLALADHQLNAAREFYNLWQEDAETRIEKAIAEFIVCNARQPPRDPDVIARQERGRDHPSSSTCPTCGWRRSMCTCR